jgi:O-antigen ligase
MDSLKRPILGHGPMSFADINTGYFRGHPHNSVLQLLYEFGYPVTITILGGVFYGIKKWVDQTKKLFQAGENYIKCNAVTRISLTVALLGGLVYSLFSGVIVMPLSQLWLAMVAGTMFGLYISESGTGYFPTFDKWKIYTVKFVVLLAAGMLLSVAIKDVPHFQENKKKYMKETSSATLRPRFWQQGKVGFYEVTKNELAQPKNDQEL